jgi:hypothetical protein
MNSYQDLFDRQKRHFASGVTRSREWRIEQLDRMGRLVSENEATLQQAIGQGRSSCYCVRRSARWRREIAVFSSSAWRLRRRRHC